MPLAEEAACSNQAAPRPAAFNAGSPITRATHRPMSDAARGQGSGPQIELYLCVHLPYIHVCNRSHRAHLAAPANHNGPITA